MRKIFKWEKVKECKRPWERGCRHLVNDSILHKPYALFFNYLFRKWSHYLCKKTVRLYRYLWLFVSHCKMIEFMLTLNILSGINMFLKNVCFTKRPWEEKVKDLVGILPDFSIKERIEKNSIFKRGNFKKGGINMQ